LENILLDGGAQSISAEAYKDGGRDKVYDTAEQMPSFPGGQAALFQWISKNIKYPVKAEENDIQGRVICAFIVERDGSIHDVQVVKPVDPLLDEEALRLVKSMPRWMPGMQNGKPIRVKYTVPITFKMTKR
jgi:protein TonB